MKKFKSIALLGCVLMGLASCSSDDDPANLSEKVAGSYDGYTVASCGYFSNMVASDQKVTITTAEIDKVNVSYESSTFGTVTIEGASLAESNGTYVITGSGKSVMGMGGNTKEYDCNVSGSLAKGVLDLEFSCPAIMGGLKIEFKQGEIPAEIVVPGTYKGYTSAKSAYFDGMMDDDQTVVITKNSDNTYNVKYSSETWGEFEIASAGVDFTDGIFAIKGDGQTKMGMNGNVKEYACSMTGSIDPEKENPTFIFSVPSVMGGVTIEFHTGDMPSTAE